MDKKTFFRSLSDEIACNLLEYFLCGGVHCRRILDFFLCILLFFETIDIEFPHVAANAIEVFDQFFVCHGFTSFTHSCLTLHICLILSLYCLFLPYKFVLQDFWNLLFNQIIFLNLTASFVFSLLSTCFPKYTSSTSLQNHTNSYSCSLQYFLAFSKNFLSSSLLSCLSQSKQ